MPAMLWAGCLPLATLLTGANAHGAITVPGPSRNAVDSNLPPWSEGVPEHVPFEYFCPYPTITEASRSHGKRNLSAANGQACFWFSNGCAPGCERCDGSTRGVVPKFEQVSGEPCGPANGTCPPRPGTTWRPVPGAKDGNHPGAPQHKCGPGKNEACPVAKTPVCQGNKMVATNCDPRTRTVNRGATCGALDDWYYYSPWRKPGAAPVIDVCGSAGGRLPGQGAGGNGASYHDTAHAKTGDLGSRLLSAWSTAVPTFWKAGSVVEVAWALAANHGGGYSYRLCHVGENLDEACMQRTPLQFVGDASLRWGGPGGRQLFFNGTDLTEGVTPPGSVWRMNPIPRNDPWGTGEGFTPVCDWPHNSGTGSDQGEAYPCQGGPETGLGNLEIVDRVKIPSNLPPGDYVLGWRWDAEESNQVWASCSDVTITRES